MPLRRFVVSDESMLPTLQPGQGLITTPWGPVRAGQVRVFQHPQRPGFWLVKRVAVVEGGQMIVSSDNTAAATVDSRVLGAISSSGSYRVLLAIPLRLM